MESREHLEQAAATWIAKRDLGPWSADDAAGLKSWLAESAGHRAAFYRLNAAWKEAGRLQVLNTRMASLHPSPQPLAPDTERPRLAQRLMSRRFVFKSAVAIAATVLIHLGVALVWLRGHHPDRDRYTTAVGELQSIPMPDGSRVTLNTNSGLRVSLKRSERRIELDYGEAFFEVAKDPKRPFLVVAGNRTIIAIGTQFSVRRDGSDVHVIVSEGTVGTEYSGRADEPDRQTPTLVTGNKALWPAGSVADVRGDGGVQVEKESLVEIDERLSWRVGRLTFRDTPLASAIVEFNRYNPRKMVIQDPALAAIRVSGVFVSTQLSPFVHLLEQQFPIHATIDDQRILLSTRCSNAWCDPVTGTEAADRLLLRGP